MHALEKSGPNFSTALVHSPEIYALAEKMGINLYLCGYTHGGQVCMPGGTPIIRHLNCGKEFYSGYWRYRNMQGVTNCGAGTSGIPVRFNTQGELLLLELQRSQKDEE